MVARSNWIGDLKARPATNLLGGLDQARLIEVESQNWAWTGDPNSGLGFGARVNPANSHLSSQASNQ